ncbi:Matrilin-2 [Bulinus truncatus]|nr:Matrilin-2 [Bulinus truncatus]
MSELNNLATDGAKQTFYIEDFSDFSDQLENLSRLACVKTESVCRHPMDMVFVIDGSNSLGEDNFNLILKTVSNAVNSLVIGPNDTRVGAVVYSVNLSAAYIDLQTNVEAFKTGVIRFEYLMRQLQQTWVYSKQWTF